MILRKIVIALLFLAAFAMIPVIAAIGPLETIYKAQRKDYK